MSKVLKSSIGHRLASSFRNVFSFVFGLQNFVFKIRRIEIKKSKKKERNNEFALCEGFDQHLQV